METKVYEKLFDPGQLVATAGVAAKMEEDEGFQTFCDISFARHLCCDWGDLDPEDVGLNEEALKTGERLFSVYRKEDTTIYIITEADRSHTTILFPEEY